MAKFKTAFVATILLFCLYQNGGAQQYEDSLSESRLGDWQPRKSRLRSKPATRSVATPSPEDIPNNSSPDVTTRTRQRTRGRNTPDPLADTRYYASDAPESQQQGFPQDQPFRSDLLRGRKDDFKNVQQRTNIKTLEDSLNTERYQKRIERPQSIRRNGFVDQTEANRPTEFGRNDDLGVESPRRRFQRTRGRAAAERRIGTTDDDEIGGGREAATAPSVTPRPRGTFRGRITFQEAQIASNAAEPPKSGRTRAFTSRYQNVETTEATVPYAAENTGKKASPPEAGRHPLPVQPIQQYPDQQFQFVQQFTVSGQPPQAGFEPILTSVQPQRTDVNQPNGRSENLFPNLSTQQFSTDPTQFVRLNNEVAPQIQEFPSALGQQFVQGNQQNSLQNQPAAHLGVPLPDVQQISDAKQIPSQAGGEAIQLDQRILRRIDGNEVERTPQFVPLEPSRGRKNFRSRVRAPSALPATLEIETESTTKSYDAQQGKNRGRQGSFRSRTRAYASNDETTTPAASLPPRSRTVAQSRRDAENVQTKSVAFRGRSRSQAVESKTSLEAKERIFTEELPDTEFNDQPSQTQIKSPARPSKPFRGTVTAKITEAHSEEDADATENYPKEFLEKLKSSKGFVPPPKRARPNTRTTVEQTFTPTAFNAGTARLKRKQFTTENYSRRYSDTSETTNRESQKTEEAQPPENDRNTERPPIKQTRERYSQRFYRKLASKSTAARGGPAPQTTSEPQNPDETARSRLPTRKSFRSFSTSTTTTTTEFEPSTTEQPAPGEERRRFVPKNKITLEERKLRIARLKEKLRQNATEGELKAAESQESFVVKESLVVQANTHPGSREVYIPEGPKHAVEAKSSASSHAKRGRQRGETKFRDVEGTSNKYDLITLGSEETFQTVVPGRNESSSPRITTTTTTTTATPRTTTRETVSAAPKAASTNSKPQAATQVPPSTTSKPDFAVLNVTLFPSTRHRFSARINSSANIVLPPDVELITTTAPSTALNAPETTTLLGRQPDFTFSVNKLFNSSLATTTSASTARAATARNSSGTALSTPSTRSISPGTTTQKTSTTTKRSSSKKKSSGRKKSKKTKSKSSGNGTTTQRPPTPMAKSTTKATPTPTAATVRTVNSTGSASNNNSTGVRPLSLAYSDIENIFNETMKVVNSNPMAGPLPGVVPRSELNALTPETLLNGTTTEDAAEGTTARAEAATSSNTNSVDNSTNQVETPERLTSDVECSNGTCTKSKSQTVHFNEGGSSGARAPLPYVRRDGTTKSPETLRRIFIYGIFPNNTVQRKPFPGEGGDERFSGGRDDAGRYSAPARPTTSVPQYTVGDYYVFGVYPNNSVVRRRSWKTFDYEKYHSPYVIFGIYPNNTIIKKFPNGTTIDDEFAVSDNEIRKTVSEGNVYRGCSCADGAHRHPVTPTVQTTEGTTQRTSTTTAMPEPPETSEGSATEMAEKPDESETEEPERNAKDDAENIDFQAESLPQAEVSAQNSTTTESGLAEGEEEEEDEDEDEEEEKEKESEGTTQSTLEESTTSSQFNAGPETTTQSPQTSLDEAEQADMVSTEGTTEETTTRTSETEGSEALENAEEADDASTPRSLEESTNSLEREETQNGMGSGTLSDAEEADAKGTVENSNASGLADAEQVDDAKIAGGTEESVNDSTTERSENIQEKIEGSDSEDNVTERNEENLDTTTAKETNTEENETVQETTEGNSERGKTEASNYLAEGTTEYSEKLVEKTTEATENEEGTSKSSENERIRDSTERISESEETTTASGESLSERTTERSYDRTTTEGEGLSTETVTESATRRAESLEERTTEKAFYERTTESGEYSRESTTEENDSRGGFPSPEENSTERSEEYRDYSTESNENLSESTTEGNDSRKGFESPEENSTERSEEYRDYSTESNENLSESTTEGNDSRKGFESPEEGSTERSEEYRDSTTESNENLSEGSTEENNFEGEIESLEDRTTESRESIGDESSERSESSVETTTEENSYGEGPEYSYERTTEESLYDGQETTERSDERSESLQESTTERNSESREISGNGEERTTESGEYRDYESGQLSGEGTVEAESSSEEPRTSFARSDEEDRPAESARTTENPVGSDFASSTEKPSAEENLIIDLNSELEPGTSTESSPAADEDVRELNQLKELAATESPRENTIFPDGEAPESSESATESASLEDRFDGYRYERPTVETFGLEDATSTLPSTETTGSDGGKESSTTEYDFDVRELGNLISRLTTGAFGDGASTDPTTEGPAAEATTDGLLNALLPLSIDYLQASADGNQVKKRHRRALDDLDEPSSLTNLAYRALSSSETTSTSIPVLTTTMTTTTTTRATKPPATASAPRAKKLKNLSKTSVTAYKNLTNLTSTPLPDEVFIVTPVASTRAHPNGDYSRRGKVKFVTLTPGVVVTTNIRDENDVLTMSSQHVQKVTKAPAKIPENFLSTVFGEIEEKASSPIPDIIKDVQNDLHGDGLSASLARRIITLALEKAMTSTTPPITPQPITATTIPAALDQTVTTPRPQSTASYIQKISEAITPTTPTTTKKPVTTKKPTTTSKRPRPTTTTTTTSTTTTTTTTTRKPFTSSTTRRPRTSSTTTTTESPQTILITPKKAAGQQAIRNPTVAVPSSEFLGSTSSPGTKADAASLDLAPLNVLFSNEKLPSTTTTPASQRITEDLNVLLSGLWEERASEKSKLPETSNLVEPKKKPTKSKSALSKEASASLSESDLKILEAILQQQGDGGANQDLEQIVQNQIRLAEEVRKASRNLKKKQRTTTTTTTERPGPLGLGFLLNLFGAGSRANGLFQNEQRNARRPRPLATSYVALGNGTNAVPDPFGEPDEGGTTGDRSARGELVSAAIDVTKAVSKFMGTVLTSAAQSFQNFFRSFGR